MLNGTLPDLWGNNFLSLEVNTNEKSNRLYCKIIVIIVGFLRQKSSLENIFTFKTKQNKKTTSKLVRKQHYHNDTMNKEQKFCNILEIKQQT